MNLVFSALKGLVMSSGVALVALIFLSSEFGWAQETPKVKPIVKIEGFAHEYFPKGRIHMNICKAQKCIPGSKVSYILSAPTDEPNFEEFKFVQKKVVSALRSRAPKGVVVTSKEPQYSQDEVFTIFKNTREVLFPSGSKMITKSTTLFGKNHTISLISSSNSEETADANAAEFMLVLVLWSDTRN